jgi:hypothetical protein
MCFRTHSSNLYMVFSPPLLLSRNVRLPLWLNARPRLRATRQLTKFGNILEAHRLPSSGHPGEDDSLSDWMRQRTIEGITCSSLRESQKSHLHGVCGESVASHTGIYCQSNAVTFRCHPYDTLNDKDAYYREVHARALVKSSNNTQITRRNRSLAASSGCK